jgi:hypothetical protein
VHLENRDMTSGKAKENFEKIEQIIILVLSKLSYTLTLEVNKNCAASYIQS